MLLTKMLRGRDPDALKNEATTVLFLAGQESDLKLLKYVNMVKVKDGFD